MGVPWVLQAGRSPLPLEGGGGTLSKGSGLGVGRGMQPEGSGSRRPEGRVGNAFAVGSHGLGDQERSGRGHQVPEG